MSEVTFFAVLVVFLAAMVGGILYAQARRQRILRNTSRIEARLDAVCGDASRSSFPVQHEARRRQGRREAPIINGNEGIIMLERLLALAS